MTRPRSRWRPPPPPGNIVKVVRTVNDVPEVAFVGYISEATPGHGRIHVTANAPEALLDSMPLPYEPPLIGLAADRQGYEFWWRQIFYVFDLPDPRLAPPLSASLDLEEAALSSSSQEPRATSRKAPSSALWVGSRSRLTTRPVRNTSSSTFRSVISKVGSRHSSASATALLTRLASTSPSGSCTGRPFWRPTTRLGHGSISLRRGTTP